MAATVSKGPGTACELGVNATFEGSWVPPKRDIGGSRLQAVSGTVRAMDGALEPTWMYSRRVPETACNLVPCRNGNFLRT